MTYIKTKISLSDFAKVSEAHELIYCENFSGTIAFASQIQGIARLGGEITSIEFRNGVKLKAPSFAGCSFEIMVHESNQKGQE